MKAAGEEEHLVLLVVFQLLLPGCQKTDGYGIGIGRLYIGTDRQTTFEHPFKRCTLRPRVPWKPSHVV